MSYQSPERIPDPSWKYDVYMSFRGPDTRHGFISHLYQAFKSAGIHAFIDDKELQSGDQIEYTLLQAIEASRVSVVVFSEDYASSRWCLDELTKIMECRRTKGQTVIPVFYGVESRDVRHQKGYFGEAFQRHERRTSDAHERINAWREALTEAANIAGFNIGRNRNEADAIQDFVKHVTSLLESENLLITEYPVGVQSHVEDVIQQLNNHKPDDVVLMGIWGMGGVGKTTIATAVYNQFRQDFDSRKFLPNIREMWESNQQVFLQEQLLNGICKAEIHIQNIKTGVAELKKRLCLKRVFIVFDDVDKIDQLEALCGSRDWFGPGSIIIVTTRDRRLLRKIGVNKDVYHVKEMDFNESLELFCWNAFKQATSLDEFAKLTEDVVAYCGGLPLALVTIGCQLFGKMKDEWENILSGLKRFPHPDVYKVLKRSYDGLNNDRRKEIFLDIASFCIGMEKGEVLQTLKDAFGLREDGIGFLEEQSLVTFNHQDRVLMHPLLRDMGREIIRDQSQTEAQRRMYDVFVSFRGEDSRSGFTSHLHSSLQNAAITVFKDDDDVDGLQRGERISIALLKAIGLSACSVIVLSTHYADSKWCLQELENIMVCHRTKGHLVFPIFLGVDPADVRYQRKESDFGKAFQSLISGKRPVEANKVQRWKEDLFEVSSLSGMTVQDYRFLQTTVQGALDPNSSKPKVPKGNESEDIKRIVKDVTRLLNKTELFIAEHPVGVTLRVRKVIEKLSNNQTTKDVRIVGIKGMGGIGKTTIAKAIYNQIGRDFEGRSFLPNIGETWHLDNGKVRLQQQLLEDIFRETRIHIHSIDFGKERLKERLGAKRVLILLDDVTDSDQLNALCGSGKWCSPGSVVIVTTRHDNLLPVCGLTDDIKKMSEAESLELFSWHAFKQKRPKEDFVKLSEDVVEYSNGLPLALEVLGSHLFGREIQDWKRTLDSLKSIPPDKVQKKLQISFDALSNNYEKEIFLDIACFFIGMDRNDVVQILKGCRLLTAENGISVLKERNLVTVDNNNMLGMHNLLRDMARSIICEQSLELEKRSRLWYDEEASVLELLENHEGTNLVAKGLSLKSLTANSIPLSKEAFKNMTKLKLLQLAGVQLDGEFKYHSGYLKWMSWHGFPLRHTPIDCYQPNIISIELESSKLQVLWKESRLLKQLKILNLSHSHDLMKTPDFSYLPNLEKLVLKDCTKLSSISYTIGTLEKILLINLEGCTDLCGLPRRMYKLKSLETLILCGCSKLDKLEEDLEQMESLAVLRAENTAIVQVPHALARLRNIEHVSLCGYEGLACDVIPSIIFNLWTSPNNILSGTSSNVFASAKNCGPRLQIKGDVSFDTNTLANCNELRMNFSESKSSLNSLLIQMGMDNSVTEILQNTISQKMSANDEHDKFSLLGDNYPYWLTFDSNGASIIFNVPHVNERDLKTMTMCIVYSSSLDTDLLKCLKNVLIINYTKSTTIEVYKRDILAPLEDDEWQSIISNLEPGDRVKIVPVVYGTKFVVKKTSVYLIYGESTNEEMENSHIKESGRALYDAANDPNNASDESPDADAGVSLEHQVVPFQQRHDPNALSQMIYQYAIAQDDDRSITEFTKNEKLVDAFQNFLTRVEAATAAPGSWISNNLLHFASEFLNTEGSDLRMRECYCLSPYIMETLASKFEEFSAGKYIPFKSIIKKHPYWKANEIRDQNLLIGPLLWKSHWWCYALDRSHKTLYVLDSMHSEPPNENRRKLDEIVSRRLEELLAVVDPEYEVTNKGFSTVYADVPKQANGYDCGVFSYKYMEMWDVGMKLPPYTEAECRIFRRNIVSSCVLHGQNRILVQVLCRVKRYFESRMLPVGSPLQVELLEATADYGVSQSRPAFTEVHGSSTKPVPSAQMLETTSQMEIDQPLSRLSDLSRPLLQNPKVIYQPLSSSLHETNPHVSPIPTSASTTAAITFSTAPSQPATCEDIPTMIQPNTFVPTMGVDLALDEEGESDQDLDFDDLDMLISKARQVYSSDGTEMISSALDDSTAEAIKPSPRETTPLSPPKGGTLPFQLREKVNEVLMYLNHSLEDISVDSTLKDRLVNALAFLRSSTSSLPDPTTPSSLEKFLDDVYSFLPNLQESQQAHLQSVQALANHDIKLKKYEDAKSRLLGVISEGKSKEKELDGKIRLLEQKLDKLRQHRQAVINQNSELDGKIQQVEKECAVKSSLRTSLAQSVKITKLDKEKAERLVQGLGQRQEDLKRRLGRMLL